MEMKELKTKKDTDLIDALKEKREALRAFHFGLSGSKVKNFKEGSVLKRDIARIFTELASRRGK